ncbi:ABC transporter substrate-binding protein [Pseudonocardia sp. GCM10023141]|uniref:ABC transporter substrate-binding protein n=1 Tax=Pseudonocardia sp. GCM10023141 TaxID=3252653 RepID=UPI003620A858
MNELRPSEWLTSRTLSRRSLLVAAGGLATTGMLAACSTGSSPAAGSSGSATSSTDTLVAGIGTLQDELVDPHLILNNSNMRPILWALSESLVRRDDDGKLTANLASKWETSTDGLTWTFTLRPDVKMQDGSVFSARDVKTAFDRVTGKNDFSFFSQLRDKYVGTTDLGDGKVQVKLKAAYPNLLDEMPDPIPTDYYNKVGDEAFRKQPIGAGAFKFVSQKIHDSVTFERFDGFFDPSRMPNFKTFVLRIVPDVTTRVAGLLSGQLDLAHGLNAASVKQLESSKDVRVLRKDDTSFGMVQFEDTYFPDRPSPLLDKRVRQALVYALDRPSMVNSLYQGFAGVVANATLPITFGNDPTLQAYPYDPAKAKQLLAEAGHPNFSFVFRSASVDNTLSNVQRLCQAMVSYWQAIGVNATYQPLDNAVIVADHRAHKVTGARLGGWPSSWYYTPYYVPHNSLYSSAYNTGVKDPSWDALIDRLDSSAPDPTKAEQVALEYSRKLYDELPIFPVLSYPTLVGVGPKVQDFKLQAGNPYFGPWGSLRAV